MEDQGTKPQLIKINWTVYAVAGFLLLIVIFAVVKFAMAPVQKLAEWEKEQTETPQVYGEPILDSLQRLMAFKSALLSLSKKDSIHLLLNVPDSTLGLFMNGVVIYSAKLTKMKIDPLLSKLPQGMYIQFFSQPLNVTSTEATIVKEPIIEKIAPKSPEELIASVTTPDTLVHQPVFVKMITENGIHLLISQNENLTAADKSASRSFWMNRRMERAEYFLSVLTRFKPYDYQPLIVLELEDKALIAIYRALPDKPKVVVRYE